MWKRGEIANFSSFPHYFIYIFLTSGVKLHIDLLNVLFNLLSSSLSQIWYVEVRISRSVSVSHLELEITRIDCNNNDYKNYDNNNNSIIIIIIIIYRMENK